MNQNQCKVKTILKNVYYLTCFHSYATKNKLEKHYKVCKNHDYCYVEIPNEYNKILKHKDEENPWNIFNPNASMSKSYTEKKMHIPSGYSLFTQCSFYATKNKLDCYRSSNGSAYDYHFIINELAKELRRVNLNA